MPAKHSIDDNNQLIITTWSGEATDSVLVESMKEYQQNIRSNPLYSSYNEILDFRNIVDIKLSTAGMVKLGRIATETDNSGAKTKLAIIVNSNFTFVLARIYITYRNLSPKAKKIIHVFKTEAEGIKWINNDS